MQAEITKNINMLSLCIMCGQLPETIQVYNPETETAVLFCIECANKLFHIEIDDIPFGGLAYGKLLQDFKELMQSWFPGMPYPDDLNTL